MIIKNLCFFDPDNELGYHHRGGLSLEEYVEFSRNADLLIHDAEYKYRQTRNWGHSTYREALDLAIQAKACLASRSS
jgi:hypothetical protein